MKVYYFGCWDTAGHYMFGPHGQRTWHEPALPEYYGDRIHLDGTLAPRRGLDGRDRRITWSGSGKTERERRDIYYGTEECPQGWCLVHHLDNGFTAMQWWDRAQGDERGACNSTVLLEGKHDFDACMAALREHFPTVLANLEKAGVQLVEVKP